MTKLSNESRAFARVLDDLGGIEAQIWIQLELAATRASHGWHLPVLGTVSSRGPELRTVVLRGVDPSTRTVCCHTDRRSPKIEQLRADDRIAWLMYDAQQRVQVLLHGRASIHTDDPIAERHWSDSRPESRRCYLAPRAPGSISPDSDVNLPERFRDHVPSMDESQAGRRNFAVIVTRVQRIDWLYLHQRGNLRARFEYTGSQPQRCWLAS